MFITHTLTSVDETSAAGAETSYDRTTVPANAVRSPNVCPVVTLIQVDVAAAVLPGDALFMICNLSAPPDAFVTVRV